MQDLDHWLMGHSFHARSPALDRSLVVVTRAANYSRLWLLIAGALALLGDHQGRKAAERGLIAIAIAAAVANGPAKLLVRRHRPSSSSRPALIRMPRSTSFPSGHSAAAFAFVTGACAELPGLAPGSFRWRAPLLTRAFTPACTTRATSRPAWRSGSGCGLLAVRLRSRAGARHDGPPPAIAQTRQNATPRRNDMQITKSCILLPGPVCSI